MISNGCCKSGNVSTGATMLQLGKHLLLGFRPKQLCFRSSLGVLTQGLSDMREPKHELAVEVGEGQKLRSSVRVVGVDQS